MYNPFDEKNINDSNLNTEKNLEAKNAQDEKSDGYETAGTQYTAAEKNISSESVNGQQYNPYNVMPSQRTYQGESASKSSDTSADRSAPHTVSGQISAQNWSAQPQSQVGSPTAYTWGAAPNQPQYYPGTAVIKKPAKQKKSGYHWGKIVLVSALCCLVVSLSTLGIFVGMIQSGAVSIQSSSNGAAAFTINKVVDENTSTDVTEISGKLTQQEVAEKVVPSVVCIQNYQISQQYSFGGYGANGSTGGDDSEVSPTGSGSGIIISEDGYIVTNAHVVEGANKLKVILSTGVSYEATLVGSDSVTDIAVVKIDATGLTKADFGSSEDLKVADEVMAIGNPGGIQFNSTVTIGYVSALNRVVTDSENGYSMSCIQTDAAINPGNSGGALVDMYGHVVGINSSKIVATGYEGLGFAIPSETVQPIVSDLMEYGYVKDRPALGISGQYIDSMTAMFYGFSSGGFYVDSMTSDEAKSSGLQRGDVITSIDGTEVTSESTITSYISSKKPGDTVSLGIVRSSTKETLNIELVLTESSGQQ